MGALIPRRSGVLSGWSSRRGELGSLTSGVPVGCCSSVGESHSSIDRLPACGPPPLSASACPTCPTCPTCPPCPPCSTKWSGGGESARRVGTFTSVGRGFTLPVDSSAAAAAAAASAAASATACCAAGCCAASAAERTVAVSRYSGLRLAGLRASCFSRELSSCTPYLPVDSSKQTTRPV